MNKRASHRKPLSWHSYPPAWLQLLGLALIAAVATTTAYLFYIGFTDPLHIPPHLVAE